MDCIFCKIANGEIPSKKIYEDELVLVIMDVNPAVDGHILIIPKKHYEDYMNLNDNITIHIFNVAKKIGKQLISKLNVKSVTLLINYGDDQKVKHYHLHLLPEYGTSSTSKAKNSIDENYKLLID